MYDGTKNTLNRVKAYFELEMECRALLLVFKDSGEVNVGKAKVYVDGEYHFTADPHINNWQHCNAVIIFNNKTSENHVVRICRGRQRQAVYDTWLWIYIIENER